MQTKKRRYADALPTDEAPVVTTVDETVNETLAETVTGTVTPTENLTETDAEPKQALKHPGKGKKKKGKREAQKPDDVSDDTWADFLEHRKNHKALVTDRVVGTFRKEAQKAKISLDEAMQMVVARGWRGFQAEWLENAKNQRTQPVDNAAAHLIPSASGRLPGESAVDFSLRLYVEDQQKQIANTGTLATGLFNTLSTPALLCLNGDTSK